MAYKSPSHNPVRRSPQLRSTSDLDRPFHPPILGFNCSFSKSKLPTTDRCNTPALTSSGHHRRNAAWPVHDRTIPHRSTIRLQSPPHPIKAHRRRPRANKKRTTKCHGLARNTRHSPKDESLHSDSIRVLLPVSRPKRRPNNQNSC